MKLRTMIVAALGIAGLFGFAIAPAAQSPKKGSSGGSAKKGVDAQNGRHALRMLDEGRRTFRYDTFGSESFWGDALQLHKAIAGEKNGGIGPGVSPKTAL